jgi:CRP/FNR family transcriptional regulator
MEKEIEVERGQYILKQGEVGRGLYILQSGALEVYKDEVLLSVIIHPGTFFGEMGDFLGKPRSCSVKAKKASKIVFVQNDDMKEMIRANPDIGIKIIKTLASRLERTTQKLVDTKREETTLLKVRKQKYTHWSK